MASGTFLPPGLSRSIVKIESGGTDNYVMTAVDGETIQGEASLQFDGDDLIIANGKGMVIGHTAPRTVYAITPEVQMLGTGAVDSTLVVGRWSADVAGPAIDFLKSRAAAIGTLHADSRTDTAGDILGEINFVSDDGSTDTETNAYGHYAAQIVGPLDLGTTASNDMPGRLSFLTAADGGSTPVERMRIDSGGDVSISTGNVVIATSGKGIDFSATANTGETGSSTVSELLDDYEEGTWTPIFSDSGADRADSQAENSNGNYTKVGNRVFIEGNLTATDLGTLGDSLMNIMGLPFTANSTNSTSTISMSNVSGLAITAGQSLTGLIIGNTTRFRVYLWDATTGTSNFLVISECTADGSFNFSGSYRV